MNKTEDTVATWETVEELLDELVTTGFYLVGTSTERDAVKERLCGRIIRVHTAFTALSENVNSLQDLEERESVAEEAINEAGFRTSHTLKIVDADWKEITFPLRVVWRP